MVILRLFKQIKNNMNKTDYKTIGQAIAMVDAEASPEQKQILSELEDQLITLFIQRGVPEEKLETIRKHNKETRLSILHASFSKR
ncbi:hypothetical protein TUMSATVNIG1_61170 (plasmid) [Vibrio nigripulchritudo]|nr:hypothetical protein VNTUMSATTG_60700 [Vibrio nigripulchritudo]BDU35508.1 hypothetical protein TUMSATVNIG1_61170 [Vibrio nigripulchritudo]